MIIAKSYDPTKPPGVNGNGKPVRVLFKNELPTGARRQSLPAGGPHAHGRGPGTRSGFELHPEPHLHLTSTAAPPRGSATGRPTSGLPRPVNRSWLASPSTRKARVSRTCPIWSPGRLIPVLEIPQLPYLAPSPASAEPPALHQPVPMEWGHSTIATSRAAGSCSTTTTPTASPA